LYSFGREFFTEKSSDGRQVIFKNHSKMPLKKNIRGFG